MSEMTYRRPGWFTRRVFNPMVSGLTRIGISVAGSRVLRVRGRSSGQWRQTPVNLLRYDSAEYLVAARGITNWVRNVRVDPRAELQLGRHRSVVRLTEVADPERVLVLRAYLAKWKWEVGAFFDGVGPDSTDDDIAAIADQHPVFVVSSG